MTKSRNPILAAALALLTFAACGGNEAFIGIDPVTGEGVEEAQQLLVVDNLYAKLREAEGLIAKPAPQALVDMGTYDAARGTFTGRTTYYQVDPRTHKPRAVRPAVSIDAIDAVLVFNIVNGSGLSVTANGRTVNTSGQSVSVNVGRDTSVSWTMSAGAYTLSDTITVSRASVVGVGAFTLAAMPVSIVYEPPMNAARTNSSTLQFRTEMTTITTVSNGSSSTATPRWATGVVLKDIMNRLSSSVKVIGAAKLALGAATTLMGSVESSATTGTTVNTDSTLGLSQVASTSMTTNARLGPGKGDLIVFYKNARVAWAMEHGEVKLALLDHGPLGIVTVDTLRSDLAAVRAGQPAAVTGLDETSLVGLISVDPLASTNTSKAVGIFGGVTLPTSRFKKETTLLLNGTTFTNAISHTVTQSDKTSTMTTETTVKNYNPGWLSLIGIGQQKAGTYTTSMSMGSSRTDTVSSTVSASFNLSAAANESYSVDVHYDNVFGGFLTRLPSAPLTFNSGLK